MQNTSYRIEVMKPYHYAEAVRLWQQIPAVHVGSNETRAAIARFLKRNPRLSFIATINSRIVGTVLCGHDGLTGFLHHVAVDPANSGKGIGRTLVKMCLNELAALGIIKCQIIVARENLPAQHFWRNAGWSPLADRQLLGHGAENMAYVAAYCEEHEKQQRKVA